MRRILAAVVVILVASCPALAQATGGNGPSKGKPGLQPKPGKGGVRFVPPGGEGDDAPDGGEPDGEAGGTETPAPEDGAPRTDMEVLIAALSQWPSDSAVQALRRAVPRYEELRDDLLAALQSRPVGGARDPRLVAGLCHLVAEAGDREQVRRMVGVLRDPAVYPRAGDILDALVRLDPVHARENLLPLLTTPSSQVVDRVAERLAPLLRPEDVPALLALAGDRSTSTRRAALGLAAETDYDAAREALVEALGDRNAQVAAAAAMSLGYRAGETDLEMLNQLVRGPDSRRASFAILALVRAGEKRGRHGFDDASITALLGTRGLSSIDPTMRILGAVALADIGYFEPLAAVDAVLDNSVVTALLEAVAGMQFFSDLPHVKPLALDRLRRLTEGTDHLRSAVDWAAWWDRNGSGFVARRALVSLPPVVRASLSVTVSGLALTPAPAGSGKVVLDVSAEGASADGGAGGRYVVIDPEQCDALAEAVLAGGLLSMPDAIGVTESVPELEVVLAAGKRRRVLRVEDGMEVPAALQEFVDVVNGIRRDNRWQATWDRRVAPTFATFVQKEAPFWSSGSTSDRDRALRRIRLTVGSLVDLPTEADRVDALASIAMEPDLAEGLRSEEGRILASFAAVGSELSLTGEAALRVLANAGRSDGMAALRARIVASRGTDGAAEELLHDTLANAPLDTVLQAASDDGFPAIQRTAILALGGRTDPQAVDLVQQAMRAVDGAVRGAAYVSYGRMRAEDALAALTVAARDEGDPAAVVGALEGLGQLGGREVIEPLGVALQSTDARQRAAAVRGLASTREPEALSLVLSLLTSDPDAGVREEAARAVQEVGGDRAREALRSIALDRRRDADARRRAVEGLGTLGARAARSDLLALLGDPEEVVADTAAFVLAWERDAEAAPRLLEALRAGRSPARTMRSLELLSLESFRAERGRDEAVSLYSGWYEVSRELGARGWLAEALRVRGLGGDALDAWAAGGASRPVAPLLVQALRDDAWFVRRAASLELKELSGLDFGDLDAWTPRARVQAIATAWREWWRKESEGQ